MEKDFGVALMSFRFSHVVPRLPCHSEGHFSFRASLVIPSGARNLRVVNYDGVSVFELGWTGFLKDWKDCVLRRCRSERNRMSFHASHVIPSGVRNLYIR